MKKKTNYFRKEYESLFYAKTATRGLWFKIDVKKNKHFRG